MRRLLSQLSLVLLVVLACLDPCISKDVRCVHNQVRFDLDLTPYVDQGGTVQAPPQGTMKFTQQLFPKYTASWEDFAPGTLCDHDFTFPVSGTDASITVHAYDDTPPQLRGISRASAPDSLDTECDDISVPIVATAKDNCDPAPSVTFSETRTNVNGGQILYRLERTWESKDACDLSSTFVQKIVVMDTVPPELIGVPHTETVECDLVPPPCVVTAIDNCANDLGEVPVHEEEIYREPTCNSTRLIKRTWTVSDDGDNTAVGHQVVSVVDTQPPVLVGIGPNTIYASCSAIPEPLDVTAVDKCDGSLSVHYTETEVAVSCGRRFVREWTASDCSGRTAKFVQTVKVMDLDLPLLSGVEAHKQVSCNTVPQPCVVTASDVCDASVSDDDVVYSTKTHPEGDDGCGDYTKIDTWTVADSCGNTATQSQTIAVRDTEPPTLVGEPFPQVVTAECGNVPDITRTANDDCDEEVSVEETVEYIGEKSDWSWTEVHTFTAVDSCGNEAVEVITIVVSDTTDPVFDMDPVHYGLSCEAKDAVGPANPLTAYDDCCDASTGYTEVRVNGTCDTEFTLYRTWRAQDCGGLYAEEVQTITITDDTPPRFNPPVPDHTTVYSTPGTQETLTATDNCGPAVVTTLEEERFANNQDCPCDYTVLRTWVATDLCQNTAEHLQSISVFDDSPPVIDPVSNSNGNCNNGVIVTPGAPGWSDDCTGNITLHRTTSLTCPTVITYTWRAIDDCDNYADRTHTITYDPAPPELNPPDGFRASIVLDLGDPIPPKPEFTAIEYLDNCTTASLTPDYDVDDDRDACGVGRITRTWSVEDHCNLTASATQIITIVDNTPPIFTVPGPLDATCNVVAPADRTDFGDVTYNPENIDITVTNRSVAIVDACEFHYYFIRTFTGSDCYGNEHSDDQTITYDDTEPPTLTDNPGDEDWPCEDYRTNSNMQLTATDNCGLSSNSFGALAMISCTEQTETWTAIDMCNNPTTDSRTVTYTDSTPPVVIGEGESSSSCYAADIGQYDHQFHVTENCPQRDPVVCPGDATTSSRSEVNSNVCGLRTVTTTFKATDYAGYFNTATVTSTWNLSQKPTATFPESGRNLRFQCEVGKVIPEPVWEVCSNETGITESKTRDDLTSDDPKVIEKYVFTYTAQHECHVSDPVPQTITISDREPPVLANVPGPQNVTSVDGSCFVTDPPSDVEATDLCEGIVDVLYTQTSYHDCDEATNTITRTIIRSWSATDSLGQEGLDTQTIIITDSEDPIWRADTWDDCNELESQEECTTSFDDSCPTQVTDVTTCTITDAVCGIQTSTRTVDASTYDTTPPVFEWADGDAPGNVTIECTDPIPAAPVVTSSEEILFTEAQAGDVCDREIQRTWTACDCADNCATAVQIINQNDGLPPLLNATNVDRNCTQECPGGSSDCTLVNFPGNQDFDLSDCTNTSVSITAWEQVGYPGIQIREQWIRTISACDECSNCDSIPQTITLVDVSPPVFDIPEAYDEDGVVAIEVTPNINEVLLEATHLIPTATDDCGKVEPKLTVITKKGPCLGDYYLIHNLTVSDQVGNEATTVVTTVHITDLTPPVLDVSDAPPGPIIVSNIEQVPIPLVTATDNSGLPVDVLISVEIDGPLDGNYTVTRLWRATDDCGNAAMHVQTILIRPVKEFAPPHVLIPCNDTATLPTMAEATVGIQDKIDKLNLNVTVTVTAESETEEPGIIACDDSYLIIRTWRFTTEGHPPAVTESQTITISPVTPTWGKPEGFQLVQEVQFNSSTLMCVQDLDKPYITVDTQCKVKFLQSEISFEETHTPEYTTPFSFHNAVWRRTWSLDYCETTPSLTQELTIVDTSTEDFVWTFPEPPIFDRCDAAYIDPPQVHECGEAIAVVPTATLTTNCTLRSVDYFWEATDLENNADNRTGHIDNALPTVLKWDPSTPLPPATQTFQVNQPAGICAPRPEELRAVDDCGTQVRVDVTNTTQSSCLRASDWNEHNQCSAFAFDWVAKPVDLAGRGECYNSLAYSQAVIIEDTTPPFLAVPPQSGNTTNCTVPPPETLLYATDCYPALIAPVITTSSVSVCGIHRKLTYEYRYVDKAGNEAVYFQEWTVGGGDIELSQDPEDVTRENCTLPPTPNVTAKYVCGEHSLDITPTFSQTDDRIDDESTYKVTQAWTAKYCNLTESVERVVELNDNVPPTFEVNENYVGDDSGPMPQCVVDVQGGGSKEWITGATDLCDEDPDFSEDMEATFTCPNRISWLKTYTAEDADENTATASYSYGAYDNTPPEFQGLPTQVNVSYQCPTDVPDPPTVLARDNCNGSQQGPSAWGSVNVVFSETTDGPTNGCELFENIPCIKTIYRSWVAVDDCANPASFDQTITVQDTIPPYLEEQPDGDQNCRYHGEVFFATPLTRTFTDNCDGEIEVTDTGWRESFDEDCKYVNDWHYSWTGVDSSGNQLTRTQVLHVKDLEGPTIRFSPKLEGGPEWQEQVVVECADAPEWNPQLSDDCSPASFLNYYHIPMTSIPVPTSDSRVLDKYIRLWSATDECNNTNVRQQTITIVDHTPPMILGGNAKHRSLECGATWDTGILHYDECGTSLLEESSRVLDVSCATPVQIQTWVATDHVGNTAAKSQTIRFFDDRVPIMTNIPGETDVVYECTPADPPVVTKSDTCVDFSENNTVAHVDTPLDTSISSYSDTTKIMSVFLRTWTATDDCGNEVSDEQTVTLIDTQKPNITGITGPSQAYCAHEEPPIPNATDCDADLKWTALSSITEGSCRHRYTVNFEWFVEDNYGNSNQGSSVIDVDDRVPPTFLGDLPDEIEYECNVTFTPSSARARDVCHGETDLETITFSSARLQTIIVGQGTDEDYKYVDLHTWLACDDCANCITEEQTIQVRDTIPPQLENLPDEHVSLSVEYLPTTASTVDDVTASDNCGEYPPTWEQERLDEECLYNFTLLRTWTTVDSHQHTDTFTQTVEVYDVEPPVIHGVPGPVTVEYQEVPPLGAALDGVWVEDNSGAINLEVIVTESTDPADITDLTEYSLTRMYTVEDDCRNARVETQVITVIDLTPPTFTSEPHNMTVQCDSIPAACVLLTVEGYDVTHSQMVTDGFYIHTWYSADDAANENSVTHQQTIWIEDTSPPVLTRYPANDIVECDCEKFPAAPTVKAVDNCDPEVDVLFSFVSSAETDNKTMPYTITRIWEARDNAGMVTTHTQEIIVQDTLPPYLTHIPGNISLECGQEEDAAVSFESLVVKDECDRNPESVVWNIDTQPAIGYPKTITYRAQWKDASSHTTPTYTWVQSFTDNQPPRVSSSPEPLCLEGNMPISLTAHELFEGVVSDACTDHADLTFSILQCVSSEPSPLGDGSFDQMCYRTETHDGDIINLYPQALHATRIYTISATVCDTVATQCVPVQRTVLVPLTEEDRASLCSDVVSS